MLSHNRLAERRRILVRINVVRYLAGVTRRELCDGTNVGSWAGALNIWQPSCDNGVAPLSDFSSPHACPGSDIASRCVAAVPTALINAINMHNAHILNLVVIMILQ